MENLLKINTGHARTLTANLTCESKSKGVAAFIQLTVQIFHEDLKQISDITQLSGK